MSLNNDCGCSKGGINKTTIDCPPPKKCRCDKPTDCECVEISRTFEHLDIEAGDSLCDALEKLDVVVSGLGASAYDIAVAEGFVGTEQEWLDSLVGADGVDGADGADGLSNYQIWLDLGNIGSEADFLTTLVGATGAAGADGADGADGEDWLAGGMNYMFVRGVGNPTVNGQELEDVYTAAAAATPNGNALSATNRMTVIVAPGLYDGTFGFNSEFVDVVSLTGNADVLLSGVMTVQANDTLIRGIDTGTMTFPLATNLSLIRIENCKGGANSFGGGAGVVVSGTFINCESGEESFGYLGTASGTFINCKNLDWDCFGSNGTASGFFRDCESGSTSFGFTGTASGYFDRCKGNDGDNFGARGTASGEFVDCLDEGTNYAFGGGIGGNLASGVFTNCRANDFSFGGGGDATGVFTGCLAGESAFASLGDASGEFNNCVGGTESFGNGAGGTLTGTLLWCRLISGSGTFQTVSGGGRTYYCIDGAGNVNNQ